MILFGPFYVRTQHCYGSLQIESLHFHYVIFCHPLCWGTRIQNSNKVGKVVSEEGNFMRSLWRSTIFLIKEFRILPLRKNTEDRGLHINLGRSRIRHAGSMVQS